MTTTEPAPQATVAGFEPVVIDLYRDIHKGIRSELFAVTLEAGRLDPTDRQGRVALADHVTSVAELLELHAEHEDAVVLPALEIHLPELGERIVDDHEALERRIAGFRAQAQEAVEVAGSRERPVVHHLYIELAAFTSAYLAHQDLEERVVMPALERAVGVEAVGAIHGAIISSIPPDEMAASLAVMLPAMNVDDRAELLGGMRDGAPPEVFEGVWGLAGSVLSGSDHAALGSRLGLG
jgi:iron-sulfur cluster repair protein YtfE (RIC family)